MKFLVDENIGTSIVRYLRSARHDVVWIKDVAPGLADRDILRRARMERRVIVTYDLDFGKLVFLGKAKHRGVILLRPSLDIPENHIRILKRFLARHTPREVKGNFWQLDERVLMEQLP